MSDKIILLTTSNNRYYHEAEHIIHLKDGKIRKVQADLSLAELEKIQKDTRPGEKKSADQEILHDPNELASGQSLKQERENREIGRVSSKVYKDYFLYGASAIVLFLFILVFFSGQGKKTALYQVFKKSFVI